jgi:hypothetical protein
MENFKVVDYGSKNGWDKGHPGWAVIKKCEELEHERVGGSIGRCAYWTQCNICGYKYSVDSSD